MRQNKIQTWLTNYAKLFSPAITFYLLFPSDRSGWCSNWFTHRSPLRILGSIPCIAVCEFSCWFTPRFFCDNCFYSCLKNQSSFNFPFPDCIYRPSLGKGFLQRLSWAIVNTTFTFFPPFKMLYLFNLCLLIHTNKLTSSAISLELSTAVQKNTDIYLLFYIYIYISVSVHNNR